VTNFGKANAKGRSAKPSTQYFTLHHHHWFQSPSRAWLALPQGAKILWMTLHSYYNGHNNGSIYLSIRSATKLLSCAKGSTEAWFKELEEKGFIKKTQNGFLGIDGKGIASKWEMTHLGKGGTRATKDFEKWENLKSHPTK